MKLNHSEISELLSCGTVIGFDRNEDYYSGMCWVGWGTPERSSLPISSALAVYAPDFFLKSERPWFNFFSFRRVPLQKLVSCLRSFSPARPSSVRIDWEPLDQEKFRARFADLQERIASGELVKGVPVSFLSGKGKWNPENLNSLLIQAAEATLNGPARIYGLWTREEGTLGFTPERLFERKGNTLWTMALAGTRPNTGERAALLHDPKEMKEHRLVVDGIVDASSRWGEVRVAATEELQLPALSHLRTLIEVELKEPMEFEELAKALHPTPALGAVPREAGWKWLETGQKCRDRKRFGAPFGAIVPDESNGLSICHVAIRNLQWQVVREGAADFALGAGVGVIAESRFEREWDEIQLKMESVRGVFRI